MSYHPRSSCFTTATVDTVEADVTTRSGKQLPEPRLPSSPPVELDSARTDQQPTASSSKVMTSSRPAYDVVAHLKKVPALLKIRNLQLSQN